MSQAAAALSAGQLVVAPTETQYGLLAVGSDPAAVERLLQVKGRRTGQPISVFLSSPDDISRYAQLTPEAERLTRAFLPGPLTLVLESRVDWGAPLVVDGKIGLRVSPLPLILQLVRLVGAPLTATSANRAGLAGSDTIDAVLAQLGRAVALYLDGGPLTGPVSSVVVCDRRGMTVLREGAIATSALHRALDKKVGD